MDEFTYSMTLDELFYEEGEPWVEDGTEYIPSFPYGISDGENFYLYLPGKPVEDIPEDFLIWWYDYISAPDNNKPKVLSCYGFYNQEQKTGFIADE